MAHKDPTVSTVAMLLFNHHQQTHTADKVTTDSELGALIIRTSNEYESEKTKLHS
jgi:hypothetical protein